VPRYNAKAITLQNGKILLMGGRTPGGQNGNESEIYDPATETWTFAGNMNSFHDEPLAVLLLDGKVLVANRHDSEIYDPQTSQWSQVGNLSGSWLFGTMTLLSSGKVLVAGGADTNGTDIFDPATNSYSSGGGMNAYRSGHIAVLLRDGKVLIAGGNGCSCGDSRGSETYASAEIYDPSNGTFTLTGSMNVPRGGAGAVLLSDGRVLVAGGGLNPARYNGNLVPSTTAEIYDPTTGTWSFTGNLHNSRSGLESLKSLPNGNILIIDGDSSGTSEEYNPTSETWSTPINFRQPQCGGATTILNDGRVLLAAGTDCAGNVLTTSEIYNQNQTPEINPLPDVTINRGATYAANGSFTDPDSTSWTATVN
jgi:hypothetical protein